MKYLLILLFSIFTIFPIYSGDLRDQLERDLDGVMTKVINWRHYFHQYPELSNREFKTQESIVTCLLYTSPSPRDRTRSRMPSSA